MNTQIIYWLSQVTIPTSQVNIPALPGGAIIETLLNSTFFIVGIISVIMVIIGGYQYTTSAGDPSGAAKGRRTIIYSMIGMTISLITFVIMQFVRGLF